jgi:hypothetical protein
MAAILAGLVVWLFVYPRAMLFGRLSFPELPEVLASDAREVIQAAGYDTRRENAYGFDHDAKYLEWVTKNDHSPNRWDRLVSPQPAAVYFWYRQSPVPLMPGPNYLYLATLEPGRITPHDPPPIVPGMITVLLDAKGRLIAFHAVPPEERSPESLPGKPDWAPLLSAAGLDPRHLAEDPNPRHVPPVYADERMAWTGVFPDQTKIPIRVEAAALAGKPVDFQIVAPWTDRNKIPTTPEAMGSNHIRAGYYLVLLVVAVILAPRNLRRGRADLTGAGRLAGVVGALLMLVWAFETRHVPEVLAEFQLFVLGVVVALWWVGFLWLIYVALEPFARRFLPETLISWARLLDGRVRDPRVGRDVLVGILAGVIYRLSGATTNHLIPGWFGYPAPVPAWDWWQPNTFVRGYWIGNVLIVPPYAIRQALFWQLFAFLLLRVLLRRGWLAGVVLVSLLTILGRPEDISPFAWPPVCWLLYPLIFGLLLFVLLRWGLLASVVLLSVDYILWFPMTWDTSAYYFWDGLQILGLVVTLAGYGFYTATGGLPLFGKEGFGDH